MTTPETWMDEARQYAAQCWCDPETSDRVMDTQLAEAVAKRIAAWMDTAAQAQHIVDYYRSLVVRCGNALGDAARTADDGGRSEDVLCAKVPELVEALVANRQSAAMSTRPTTPESKQEHAGYSLADATCSASRLTPDVEPTIAESEIVPGEDAP